MVPDHYPEVVSEIRADLPGQIERANNPVRNVKGVFTRGLAGSFRSLAVVGFLVERDVDLFRGSLVNSTQCTLEIFNRFEAGDHIDPSLVSMMGYQALLDALASADLDCSRKLSHRLGGRPDIERTYNRQFESALGYALKAILADDDLAALERIEQLERASAHREYVHFAAYAPVLRGILRSDTTEVHAHFPELLAGHRRESKGRGLFRDSVDEFLCVWGVGLLNLARSRGIEPKVDDPLIPPELVL